jgi:putative aldouronate transport system substrate-binding protein
MGTDTANTIVNWYETEVYKQQALTKRAWYEKGYTIPDSISNGYTVHDSMSQGTVFSYLAPIGTGQSVAYWSAQTGKNLASVPLADVKISASGTVNLSWGISSNCENPQKVVAFLELLYTNTDLANLISYGIEGTHYAAQDGSKIIKYPDGVDATSVGYGSFIGPFGDASMIYFREPLTDEFANTIDEFGITKAKASQYMSYTFDTSKVQTELAAVRSVISQYAPSLACGVIEVEKTLAEFKEALKNAGMDKVIAENQSQLNTWLESNKQ